MKLDSALGLSTLQCHSELKPSTGSKKLMFDIVIVYGCSKNKLKSP